MRETGPRAGATLASAPSATAISTDLDPDPDPDLTRR